MPILPSTGHFSVTITDIRLNSTPFALNFQDLSFDMRKSVLAQTIFEQYTLVGSLEWYSTQTNSARRLRPRQADSCLPCASFDMLKVAQSLFTPELGKTYWRKGPKLDILYLHVPKIAWVGLLESL
jgi:hypothetical protein